MLNPCLVRLLVLANIVPVYMNPMCSSGIPCPAYNLIIIMVNRFIHAISHNNGNYLIFKTSGNKTALMMDP